MATSLNDPEATARGTLALLETRLRRLEFLLTGSSKHDSFQDGASEPLTIDETVTTKLQSLDAGLSDLRRLDGLAGSLVRDMDKLYSKSPDLFSAKSDIGTEIPKLDDLSTSASVVLSQASLYPETASRLSSLQTLTIPPAEQSTKLIELGPRLDTCHQRQSELEEQILDLRQRSARCLEWWVRIGVVGMGDLWVEWEDRIGQAERTLVWQERRQKEQEEE